MRDTTNRNPRRDRAFAGFLLAFFVGLCLAALGFATPVKADPQGTTIEKANQADPAFGVGYSEAPVTLAATGLGFRRLPLSPSLGEDTPLAAAPIYVAGCIYGQSNAGTSNGGDLPVSTTNGGPAGPPYNNVEYRTSAFFPAYSNTGAANTEELAFGAFNQLASVYFSGGSSAIRAASQENAVGSQSYAQLANGTGNWTAQWTECAAMRTAYTTAFPGATAPTPLVVWLQGETNQVLGTSRATYVANLNTLWTDVCAQFAGPPWSLGAACPQIYMIPYGGVTRLGRPGTATFAAESEIVLAHYEACRDNPERFVCPHFGYATTMVVANEHKDSEGYRTNGAQIARVFRARALQSIDWRMLRPNPATLVCSGNTVTIPLIGGTGTGITVDTTFVAPKPNLGFQYSDTGVDPATIQNAEVVGESVVLTLSRGCTTGARVRYAAIGEPTCNSGRTGTCGTGGNIRRTTCEAAYWGGETLCDWLAPFDQAVATIASTPDLGRPFAAFVDTGVTARAPTGTSWFTARSSAATDSVANMTVSAWILTPASTAANQVIVERWGATGARNWSLRTEATQRLSIYLSADGTAISQLCNTPNSVMTANTWTHVAFVKSGTTLTPYVNGVATTCAGAGSTGATPASLGPGFSSPITFGGSVPGTNNFPMPIAHVAIWTRALSVGEVGQLRTTAPYARPLDPRPLGPAHYWPMNGYPDDLGTYATPRPVETYGTASYVETASLFGASDSGHAFGATGAGVLDGATAAWFRTDVTMPAAVLPQEGTIIERDDASSANRQFGLSINTSSQLIVRIAGTLAGTGQWPVDAGRIQCTTVEAMTTSTRYRYTIRYLGGGATNAERLRVWRSTVITTAYPDGRSAVTVSTPVEQTCTFLGTVPATLTTPVATGWSVGRRTAALSITGLRNAQLNGNAVAIWAGLVGDPAVTPAEITRASNVYNSLAGVPSLVFRARGPGMVETQVLGASTPSGATSLVYVFPGEWTTPTRRGGYPLAYINTLDEPGRTLLGATQTAGTSPWSISPSASAPGWTESGIDIITYQDNTLVFPIVTGALPETITLVSSTEAAGPAGLFTSQGAPRAFNPASGFAAETCNQVTPNDLGVRGGIMMFSRDFGALFEPEGLDFGYGHNSTRNPATSGWQWVEYGATTDLGVVNAPRDGRLYCSLIVVDPGVCSVGTPCTGYALLIDMSVPNGPRTVDQRTFSVINPDTLFIEINASCCQVSSPPGGQRTMTVWKCEGNLQYSGSMMVPFLAWRRRRREEEGLELRAA